MVEKKRCCGSGDSPDSTSCAP